MAKNTLLESVSLMGPLEKMRHIAALRANSKRKRLSVLYRLLLPKQTHIGTNPPHLQIYALKGGELTPTEIKKYN
jgi:hypothetical protein